MSQKSVITSLIVFKVLNILLNKQIVNVVLHKNTAVYCFCRALQ